MSKSPQPILDLIQRSHPNNREKLLSVIVERQLSLQDDSLSSVLELEKIKRDFQRLVAIVTQLKQVSNQEMAELRQENQRLTKLTKGVTSKADTCSGWMVWPLIAASLVGCILSGCIAFYFIIPQKIEAQRGKDLKALKFINSNEGKTFQRMLQLNKGYFPDKCQKDARNNGISIVFQGKKEEKVCILRIP